MKNIHSTAYIGQNVYIEDDVYIGPYCIIGFPAEWKGKEHIDAGVVIRRGTRITGMVTIDSGVENPTYIGKDCYLMKHCHIGHDAQLGNNIIVSCGSKIGGHSIIGNNCNLGLNSVIHQKLIIPEGCMIGACAFVGKKSVLKPFRKYVGVPVKDIGSNVKNS